MEENIKNILIRKANLNDLNLVQKLNNSLFELEFNNFDDTLKVGWSFEKEGKEYFQNMLNTEIVFIAEVQEKIVGYLAGSICKQTSYITESFAELDNMNIDDEYRRLGIGTLLIDEFKKYCKGKNVQNIKVTASAKNNRAIQFYMKNGFEDYNVTLKYKI